MNRKGLLFSVLLFALLLLLAACGGSTTEPAETDTNEADTTDTEEATEDSGDYEETTIRLAYNLPQDHHVADGVEQFAENVTEKSGGNVDDQDYPAGQLLSDTEMNQSVLTGEVEIGGNSSTLCASTAQAMGVCDVRYAFTDYAAGGEALSGEGGDKLRDAMDEKGAKVLMFADYGFVQFANNKHPLESPEDFEGLKIRSIGDIPS